MKLIFKNQSTELFSGRRPNIKIDRSILLPSVMPISLKVIEEDQEIDIDQSNIESFYRKVKYVSIDEQEEKPKVYLTMEYHVSSMNKIKGILEQVCDFALSPIEKTSLVRQYSTSSTAITFKMNQKLFYVLLSMIGISSALPIGQEHDDTYDLSSNDYIPAENLELTEEDFHRSKRQADHFKYHNKINSDPQTFFNAAGGGNFHNRHNWDGNIAVSAGAKA
ncbi:unnamed protein product [Rotaria sordida]|uniref:Uncharacterized protein n=1 Tax=Rotaria sordida TaxID=392033 RepID=A0A815LV74_9BILA|nr:unnamed protein product [Rotaria sordida]